MDTDRLALVAKVVSARNVPSPVHSVMLTWQETLSEIGLHFYSERQLTEDEREMCEIALTELYADVWQNVRNTNSSFFVCVQPSHIPSNTWLVYSRPNPSFQRTAFGGR